MITTLDELVLHKLLSPPGKGELLQKHILMTATRANWDAAGGILWWGVPQQLKSTETNEFKETMKWNSPTKNVLSKHCPV